MKFTLFSAPNYQGPKSDHFDGTHFFNNPRTAPKTGGDVWKWRMTSKPGPWHNRRGGPPGTPPPQRVDGNQLLVTFVNHATVLIQTAGMNIVTDPIWSNRTSPLSWAGPARLRDPGIRFDDLPSIDVVLVSHNHYDHLDIPTLRRIARRDKPPMLMPLGNKALLDLNRIDGGSDMDWWDAREFGGSKITCVPAQHWSGRGLADRFRNLWSGFVIESAGGVIYFAGDTGFGPHFQAIRDRFGPPRLAILPIGAFEPRWFMKDNHQNPEEAVKAHRILGAKQSMAIHFGTFRLADDGMDQPAEDLGTALQSAGVPAGEFCVPGNGEAMWVGSV